MAIYWPSATSSCRVDLLTATYAQVYQAAKCSAPRQNPPEWTAMTDDVWSNAQGLKAMDKIVAAVGPGIAGLFNNANSYIRNELPDVLSTAVRTAQALGLNAQAALQADIAYAAQKNKSILDQVAGGIGGF